MSSVDANDKPRWWSMSLASTDDMSRDTITEDKYYLVEGEDDEVR